MRIKALSNIRHDEEDFVAGQQFDCSESEGKRLVISKVAEEVLPLEPEIKETPVIADENIGETIKADESKKKEADEESEKEIKDSEDLKEEEIEEKPAKKDKKHKK